MTRAEAIKRLKEYSQYAYGIYHNEQKDEEAFNMAIEALSEPRGDLISRKDALNLSCIITGREGDAETIKKCFEAYRDHIVVLPSAETHEIRTETHGVCSDLISRADAINAIFKVGHEHVEEKVIPLGAVTDYSDAIKSLPSAEAEWIPCSERLPSEDGRYLVTYPLLRWQNNWINLMHYGKPSMPNCEVKGKCFYVSDDEWGDVVYDNILAWMPLPEPYREDGEA